MLIWAPHTFFYIYCARGTRRGIIESESGQIKAGEGEGGGSEQELKLC